MGILVLVIAGGTLGFIVIEDATPLNALYMTVITLSTVGFSEVVQLHDAGRLFVIFLIMFGVGAGGFTISVLGQLVLEGQFKEIYGRRKMEKKIEKMSGHFILAGYGRVGRQVAHEFKERDIPLIVIEKDTEAIQHLFHDGYTFIQGGSNR